MVEATFQAPKRKRRVYESYEAPLPLLFTHEGTISSEQEHHYAEMINDNVIVRKPKSITALYGKGYFGKGMLSRSRPDYNISDPALLAKWKDYNSLHLPIISLTKFQHRVNWARSLLQAQGQEDSYIEKMLQNYTQTIDLPSDDKSNKFSDGSQEINRNAKVPTTETDCVQNPGETQNGKISLQNKQHCSDGDTPDDLLAKGGYCETEEEDLVNVHCPRHNDFIIHCGCRYKDILKEAQQHNSIQDNKLSTEHEYLLVVENIQPGDDQALNSELTERIVCKRNPFKVFEYLQLSLEEEPLTIVKLWEAFSAIQPGFKTNYMGYHYFRSKGWVPKTGLKYGTDFLLYRKGPPFYHASYSVVVEMVDDSCQGLQHRPFTWRSLAGLVRTTANVSKELLLCYLIRPSNMTEEEMTSPECMKKIKVQELIASRWISSRERTDQDEW
ncbi:tRNA-splicing endonuclease subunit Sen2 isoform X2 [Narcine bancroftii]|uniref:tRNA-splicing endonuclease subunit Sen2 isoform X2 n=1 Tax=Narcine bancroftii TaxID=1343680 RepID=UPI0038321D07